MAKFDIETGHEFDSDRLYVTVDDKFDLAIIRTGQGLILDVYPKDRNDCINTMTIWNDDIPEPESD